jgi:hypothetical protein
MPRSPCSLSPFGFQTKTLHAFLNSIIPTICPSHAIFLNMITPIITQAVVIDEISSKHILGPWLVNSSKSDYWNITFQWYEIRLSNLIIVIVKITIVILIISIVLRTDLPGGGGLEYLHHSPASCRGRREGNPVPGGITGLPRHRGT